MRVAFGCDPNASRLKAVLLTHAVSLGHEVVDLGSTDPIYANTAVRVAETVVAGGADRGVVLCGTGIGMSVSANKVTGAYCALVTDTYQAQRAQLSNNANMIAIGAQVTGEELAKCLLGEYLAHSFDPQSRSFAKVQSIANYERTRPIL